MQRARLPYVIVGGIRFYDRREIRDVLSYLRLLVNPADDIALRRIINTPRRGIGDTSLDRLQAFAQAQGWSLSTALEHLDDVPNLSGRAHKSLAAFAELIGELMAATEARSLPELGFAVVEKSGTAPCSRLKNTPEAEARLQNIDQLLADMTEFADANPDSTLATYLEEKSLLTSADESDNDGNAITLMTLHGAKGLEFPLVFVCGLEENLFPTGRAVDDPDPQAIEEERRLCYVGMTRAQEQLSLTYALRRYAYGSLLSTEPSRFLSEVPTELTAQSYEVERGVARARQRVGPPPRKKAPQGVHYEPDSEQSSGFDEFVAQDDFLAEGQWVRHPQWGRGQIVSREGHGEKMKLSIRFGTRTKRIAVAYAQLEPA